jgi:hypothetical protein
MPRQKNCPFYGMEMDDTHEIADSFTLKFTDDNQCALTNKPCVMEVENKPVEWSACPKLARMRLGPLPGAEV